MIELTETRHYVFTDNDIKDCAKRMIDYYGNKISTDEVNDEIDELLAYGCDELEIDTSELLKALIKELGDKYEAD